jgi:hypothetical protein
MEEFIEDSKNELLDFEESDIHENVDFARNSNIIITKKGYSKNKSL